MPVQQRSTPWTFNTANIQHRFRCSMLGGWIFIWMIYGFPILYSNRNRFFDFLSFPIWFSIYSHSLNGTQFDLLRYLLFCTFQIFLRTYLFCVFNKNLIPRILSSFKTEFLFYVLSKCLFFARYFQKNPSFFKEFEYTHWSKWLLC